MPICPKCGQELSETDNFCRRCGCNLAQVEAVPSTPEEAVKAVLTQRIDGIKRKDAQAIMNLVDETRYTKFDDWPPFERQGSDALNLEAEALKVLKEYDYEVGDWRIDILNDAAIASFIINYRGKIRDLSFKIKSRVTALLTKKGERWRIVHEHWSHFPQQQHAERKTLERRRRFPF